MSLAREWMWFLGASGLLGGVSLAAGAERHVEDVLSWQRQWRQATGVPEPADHTGERRMWLHVYRFGGLFVVGVGAGLLYAGEAGLGPASMSRAQALLCGAVFTSGAAAAAWYTYVRDGRRGPRFLDGELLAQDAPLPAGERLSVLCKRVAIALTLAFGARLLGAGLR